MKSKRGGVLRVAVALTLVVIAGLMLCVQFAATAESGTTPQKSGENLAPIAENLEFTTYKNVSITEYFKGVDPEGDLMTFEIVGKPKKGEALACDDGSFTYTPKSGYKGKDSFTYVAIDAVGNVSGPAAVKIQVKKQSSKTTYSDMSGNSANFAALALAESGVFVGEKLGDEYFFRPDAQVSRAEFLAMCLKISDTDTLTGITRTGFYDDESIPAWVKPYVSTALMSGYISGYKDSAGNIVFSPDSPITFSEAAVILDNILNITDVVSVSAQLTDPSVPVWAYKAAVNLTACEIIPEGVSDMYGQTLTRADAAKILLRSADLIAARAGDKTLLGWAK